MKPTTLLKRMESLLNNLKIINAHCLKQGRPTVDTHQLEARIKQLKELTK